MKALPGLATSAGSAVAGIPALIAGGLIRRIEEYREATGRQAWIKSTRVMQAIVAYARATRRDARKAKGGR